MGKKKKKALDDLSFPELMELELEEWLKDNPERKEQDFQEWWVKKQQNKNGKWMV